MAIKSRLLFYDFEVFKYDWMVVIIDYSSRQEKVIVNDVEELKRIYLKFKDSIWVGYNSRFYDSVILKSLLLGMNPKEVNDKLIVDGLKGHQISNKFNNIKLYNYDTIILNTSLKQLEGFMGENIKETSVDFNLDRKLTQTEIEETIKYCRHDVEQTIKVFEATKSDFDAHVGMINVFNLSMSDFNKTKAKLSAKALGAERLHGLNDEFDYYIPDCIKLDKYKYVLDWFLDDENRCYTKVNEKGKNVKNQLKTDVMGVEHIFGFGGVHGAIKKYKGEGLFIMSDISSMYPATMINFNLLSRAVKNPEKYRQIRDDRLEMKKNKDARQYPMKILLNSTYGILKDQHSDFYDPRQANSVCIVGQVAILDLLEKLEYKFGDKIELIQSNTDGILVKLTEESLYEEYLNTCKEWELRTGYELEHDEYVKVFQKDVNNYVIVDKNGKFKSKGAYVKKLSKIDYNLAIVNKALVEYFINDTPIEETINNCDNLIDFQNISKIGSTYSHIVYGDKRLNEKVIRTFAATKDLPGVFKIKYVEKDGEMIERVEKIANTPERCFINNDDINDVRCPEYLDKEYYIEMAKKRLKDFVK